MECMTEKFLSLAFQHWRCAARVERNVSRNLAQNFEHTADDEMPFINTCVFDLENWGGVSQEGNNNWL